MKPFTPTNRRQRQARNVFIVLLGVIALVGCSTNTKNKWLSVFFDGVPDPNAPKTTNGVVQQFDETGQPLGPGVFVKSTNIAAVPRPFFVAHPPYEEKNCTECHESRFSVRMKAPQQKLCFECHDDFLEKLKFKHQPAENGECSSCHDPHGSALPKMMKFTGKAACAECHDDFLATAKFKHAPAESGECLQCHAPHAAPNKFLLPKTNKAMCLECHDDFTEKAAFQHTVVSECSSCHNAHKSDDKALLITSRAQLCLECHETKDLSPKGHAQMGSASCLDCHDPHVGKDKFLLKPAAATLGAPKP